MKKTKSKNSKNTLPADTLGKSEIIKKQTAMCYETIAVCMSTYEIN